MAFCSCWGGIDTKGRSNIPNPRYCLSMESLCRTAVPTRCEIQENFQAHRIFLSPAASKRMRLKNPDLLPGDPYTTEACSDPTLWEPTCQCACARSSVYDIRSR